MKVKLTLIYEKEIEDDDIDWLKESFDDKDEQALGEFFDLPLGDSLISKEIDFITP